MPASASTFTTNQEAVSIPFHWSATNGANRPTGVVSYSNSNLD